MSLANKIALVTGAGAGIGRAIALRLAGDGADIAVADLREDAAADTAAQVRALGRRAEMIATDVTDPLQVRAMVKQAASKLGTVHILVNNAGGSTFYAKPGEQLDPQSLAQGPENMSLEFWNRTLALNTTSTFLCSQAAIPIMKEQKYGRIVNLASIMGRTSKSTVSGVAYSTAKGGVIALTRFLAGELASFGITVNAIAPGMVLTERWEGVYASDRSFQSWASQTLSEIPLGRGAKPAEQAAVVAFLVSDDASYVTGAIVDVNGGWFMG